MTRFGVAPQRITGDVFLIATGAQPQQPEGVAIDGTVIVDSDSLLRLERIPASMIVVGGGVVGCEYACIFAALGVRVTIVTRAATTARASRRRALRRAPPADDRATRRERHARHRAVDARRGKRPRRRAARRRRRSERRLRAVCARAASARRPISGSTRSAFGEMRAASSRSTSAIAPRCRASTRRAT